MERAGCLSIASSSIGRQDLATAGGRSAGGRTNSITNPQVTVIVQEINSEKFNILGQVAKPGAYSLTHVTTVLDAIAGAGGFRDFAKQRAIYILRQNPAGGESRIPFNYKDVIKGKNPEQNIKLEPRDTVVVP
jgi:polysaccharide export outer membrane protein